MTDIRAIFDPVIDSFPHTESELSTYATIISSNPFQYVVVEVQLGNSVSLSREEHSAVVTFEKSKKRLLGNRDTSIYFVD